MINFQIPNKNQNFRLIVIAAIVGLCWSAMIGGSLLWEIGHQKHAVLLLSATEARASFKKDLIYRKWAADHGGVYVPVTDKTPPNPYLSHIKERDLLTPSGKKLTLVNPAYMTRQVHELGQEQYKIKGHITSLNPIRPQNAPDQWEAEALKILEQGQTEVQSVQIIDGIRYMRLMKPFFTEKPCLKCHASQGYKEGDLRGGVSVSVPLSPYEAIVNKNILMTILVHTAMIILGIVSLVVTSFIINKRNRDRFFVEQALRKSEEKHRKLVSNISDVIVIMDKEGVITYKSSNITEQFGWKPDDLIGKHGLFTVHPDDQEKIGEALTIVLKKDNATVQVEFNYLCKDGSVKPVELTAVNLVNDTVINGVLANYKDITDRKYSEAILKQSEEKYRT
ncbi:MAG: DUF3365 domain-containing protein, partial [Desulfobacteraceae bacterium]|nr:DUF3365 domain-containing protein [Desulfobacteraceae bacterium]